MSQKQMPLASLKSDFPKRNARFFRRMLGVGLIAGGLLLTLRAIAQTSSTASRTEQAVPFKNVYKSNPNRFIPLPPSYPVIGGRPALMGPVPYTTWIGFTADFKTIEIPDVLARLGIERFSEDAKIFPAHSADGMHYYIILDKGMKGLILVGVQDNPDGKTVTRVIATDSDKPLPLPEDYTVSTQTKGGTFAFATIGALFISHNGGDVLFTFDSDPPANPRVEITYSDKLKAEVRVFDENWKNECLVVRIGKTVETSTEPIASVYPK